MNLDDVVAGGLQPEPLPPEVAAALAAGGEAAALAPELAAIRAQLAAPTTWIEPPADLEHAVVAAIAAEAGAMGADRPAAEAGASVVDLADARRRRGGRRSPWRAALPAAAAATVVVGIVGVNLVRTGGDDVETVEVALAGTELAPEATATAAVEPADDGLRVELDVQGLPDPATGSYYQAWVTSGDEVVALGTFVPDGEGGGTAVLWSGVGVDAGALVTVTVEPRDGDPAPSGRRVLEGTISVTVGSVPPRASSTTAPAVEGSVPRSPQPPDTGS